MEYGNTSDSKLYAQGAHKDQVAFWMLNKVKDRIGNYYTVYIRKKMMTTEKFVLKQIDIQAIWEVLTVLLIVL